MHDPDLHRHQLNIQQLADNQSVRASASKNGSIWPNMNVYSPTFPEGAVWRLSHRWYSPLVRDS